MHPSPPGVNDAKTGDGMTETCGFHVQPRRPYQCSIHLAGSPTALEGAGDQTSHPRTDESSYFHQTDAPKNKAEKVVLPKGMGLKSHECWGRYGLGMEALHRKRSSQTRPECSVLAIKFSPATEDYTEKKHFCK